MPVSLLNASVAPASVARPDRFNPPHEEMLLTRTLKRPLSGGYEILTRRSYEILIAADGDGFRVDGKLIDVEVEAPPSLKALAAIERSRPDEGMFPMMLDSHGRLLSRETQQPVAVRKASDAAHKHVAAAGISGTEKQQANAFVSQLEKRAEITRWPDDLFAPAAGHHLQEKTIPLPGGGWGRVSITTDARPDHRSGLLDFFSRTVTTELEGSTRISQETWTLSRKSQHR